MYTLHAAWYCINKMLLPPLQQYDLPDPPLALSGHFLTNVNTHSLRLHLLGHIFTNIFTPVISYLYIESMKHRFPGFVRKSNTYILLIIYFLVRFSLLKSHPELFLKARWSQSCCRLLQSSRHATQHTDCSYCPDHVAPFSLFNNTEDCATV